MFECVPVITTPSGGKTFSLCPLKDLQAVKIIHSVLCFDMVLVNNNKRKQNELQVNNGKLLDGERMDEQGRHCKNCLNRFPSIYPNNGRRPQKKEKLERLVLKSTW